MSKVIAGETDGVRHAYTISSVPMEKISIDTLGPFRRDGNIYIIVVIDCFSCYVELFPATDCTAEAAARAIVTTSGPSGLQYARQWLPSMPIGHWTAGQYVNILLKTCVQP
jgi:hypothetical protein